MAAPEGGPLLRILIDRSQTIEARGAEADVLFARLQELLGPRAARGATDAVVDLRDAGAPTLVLLERDLRVPAAWRLAQWKGLGGSSEDDLLEKFRARKLEALRNPPPLPEGVTAKLVTAISADPRASPRPAESLLDRELDELAAHLADDDRRDALTVSWLGGLAPALVARAWPLLPRGPAVALARLLPLEERARVDLALADHPHEATRLALFEMLASGQSWIGPKPRELPDGPREALFARGLADASGRVRAQALSWVRQLGQTRAVAASVRAGVTHPDPVFRAGCIRALADLAGVEDVELARAGLASADEGDALAAVDALRALGDSEGLRRATEDPRPAVCARAAAKTPKRRPG